MNHIQTLTQADLDELKKKALDKAKALQDYYIENSRVQERNSLLTTLAMGFATSFATTNAMKDGDAGDKEIAKRAFSLAKTMLEERVKHLQELPEPPEQDAVVLGMMGLPGFAPAVAEEVPRGDSGSGTSLPPKKS